MPARHSVSFVLLKHVSIFPSNITPIVFVLSNRALILIGPYIILGRFPEGTTVFV